MVTNQSILFTLNSFSNLGCLNPLEFLAADKLNDLRDEENLPDAPILVVPYAFIYNKKLSNYERVSKIQKYIDELSYNHTGSVR